ncbi:hypothetical protein DITRI_Ditri12bG0016400 [Diplodiscus trichospermus]
MSSEVAASTVKATEIIVQEESNLLDASSETSDFSITKDDKNVDICEVCDDKQYPQCLKPAELKPFERLSAYHAIIPLCHLHCVCSLSSNQFSFFSPNLQDASEEEQQPFSPLASPSNSTATKKVEDQESVDDIQEQPSPVSVIEPMFVEDVTSPESIRSHSGETSKQPLRIHFEEQECLVSNHVNHNKACSYDKELTFEHIKAVLQASSFNWDELYIRSLTSDLLLDPSLLDEVEYSPNQLCHDQKLLFDCINEVLIEVCEYYFGSPVPLPHTLDQIVKKDMAKTGTRMDLRLDIDCIGVEMG